jgi:hypothetical protein
VCWAWKEQQVVE